MSNPVDAIKAVIDGGRGDRPYSLDSQETEQVLAIALALLVELSVSNQRIDRLEREVAALRGVDVEELQNAPLDASALTERQEAMEALQLRVLRIMVDQRQKG